MYTDTAGSIVLLTSIHSMKHEEHSSLKEIYGTFSHEWAKYFNTAKGPLKYLKDGNLASKEEG